MTRALVGLVKSLNNAMESYSRFRSLTCQLLVPVH